MSFLDELEQSYVSDEWVAVSEIYVSKLKIDRNDWDKDHVEELAESMKGGRQIYPALVRKKQKRYELIIGECRLDAARKNGEQLLIRVVNYSDKEAVSLMISENKDRGMPSDYSMALAYQSYLDKGLFKSQKELAAYCKLSEDNISKLLSLSKIPQMLKNKLDLFKLSSFTFYELSRLSKEGRSYVDALIFLAPRINAGLGWRSFSQLATNIVENGSTGVKPAMHVVKSSSRQVLGEFKPTQAGFSFKADKLLDIKLTKRNHKELQKLVADYIESII